MSHNTTDPLYSQLVRLAHAHPELRGDLLPLLKEAGTYQDYVKRKQQKGEKPLDEEAWKARTQGGGASPAKKPQEKGKGEEKKETKGEKDSTPTTVDKKLGDVLSQWHSSGSDPIYAVSSNASAGKPVPKHVAEAALAKVTSMIDNADAHGWTPSDVKELNQAKKLLEKSVGKKSDAKKPDSKSKSWKKNYGKSMESVMGKHSLTDADAEQVLEFRKERPRKGQPASPSELLRRFMQKAKPETKERMKGVSPQEFMKMLGVIFDDEEGVGKSATTQEPTMAVRSLRSGLIRLAHDHPEFRKDLLPIITACGCESEGPMMGKFEEGKPADPTKHMSPEDAEEWRKNTDKYEDKFKNAGCEKLPEGGMRDNCEKKKQEGGGEEKEDEKKEASLRAGLIRLAHTHPEFRKDILPLLR